MLYIHNYTSQPHPPYTSKPLPEIREGIHLCLQTETELLIITQINTLLHIHPETHKLQNAYFVPGFPFWEHESVPAIKLWERNAWVTEKGGVYRTEYTNGVWSGKRIAHNPKIQYITVLSNGNTLVAIERDVVILETQQKFSVEVKTRPLPSRVRCGQVMKAQLVGHILFVLWSLAGIRAWCIRSGREYLTFDDEGWWEQEELIPLRCPAYDMSVNRECTELSVFTSTEILVLSLLRHSYLITPSQINIQKPILISGDSYMVIRDNALHIYILPELLRESHTIIQILSSPLTLLWRPNQTTDPHILSIYKHNEWQNFEHQRSIEHLAWCKENFSYSIGKALHVADVTHEFPMAILCLESTSTGLIVLAGCQLYDVTFVDSQIKVHSITLVPDGTSRCLIIDNYTVAQTESEVSIYDNSRQVAHQLLTNTSSRVLSSENFLVTDADGRSVVFWDKNTTIRCDHEADILTYNENDYAFLGVSVSFTNSVFRLDLSSSSVLHHIIRLNLKKKVPNIDKIFSKYTSSSRFLYSLETLLYEVCEEECGSAVPPTPFLPKVHALLLQLDEASYFSMIAQCARKVDQKYWRKLFLQLGEPAAMFLECVEKGHLQTATQFLIIVQTYEGKEKCTELQKSLLSKALEAGDYAIAEELIRYLSSISQYD